MSPKTYKIYKIVNIISVIIMILCILFYFYCFFWFATKTNEQLEVFFENNFDKVKPLIYSIVIITIISPLIISHCGKRMERYKLMEVMFTDSKLMKYREELLTESFIKKELGLNDEPCEENHEIFREELTIIADGLSKLGDSFLAYAKKVKFREEELLGKIDKLHKQLSSLTVKMMMEKDLNKNGMELLKEEIGVAHSIQKTFDNYIYKSKCRYEYNNQTTSNNSQSYNYTSNTSKEDEKETKTTSNKKMTPEEKRSRERYSDEELDRVYGLFDEQKKILREKDLDPWNFEEEELTSEDYYYEDDFYQDKIKRGEEKEEP